MELFEAIPMTVEITENANGERLLQLTDSERLAVLADQVSSMNYGSRSIVVSMIEPVCYLSDHLFDCSQK